MCDFQQFYGVELPLCRDEFPPTVPQRWAVLWRGLPRESRTARRHDPSLEWTDADYMLRSIEYNTSLDIWSKTKDAERGRNRPKPVLSPIERAEEEERARERAERERAARERLMNLYNIKEDGDGQ